MEHQVSVFHQGTTKAKLPASVQHLLSDRSDLILIKSDQEWILPQVVLDMFSLEMIGVRDRFHYIKYSAFNPFNTFWNIAAKKFAIYHTENSENRSPNTGLNVI